MIYTLGTSYTNWIYPTWSDYIALVYNVPVKNYGYPAIGNDIIKKFLYSIDNANHVFIMFGGNSKLHDAVDFDYMIKHNKQYNYKEFYDTHNNSGLDIFLDGSCGFVRRSESTQRYKKEFSLFHAYVQSAENILDCQNYCKANNIDFSFLSWQNLWLDFCQRYDGSGIKPKNNHWENHPVYRTIIDRINKDKFCDEYPIGLHEFTLNNDLLNSMQNSLDTHPNTYAHFKYFEKYIKPLLDKKYTICCDYDKLSYSSKEAAKYYKNCTSEEIGFINDEGHILCAKNKQKAIDFKKFMFAKFFNKDLKDIIFKHKYPL